MAPANRPWAGPDRGAGPVCCRSQASPSSTKRGFGGRGIGGPTGASAMPMHGRWARGPPQNRKAGLPLEARPHHTKSQFPTQPVQIHHGKGRTQVHWCQANCQLVQVVASNGSFQGNVTESWKKKALARQNMQTALHATTMVSVKLVIELAFSRTPSKHLSM